MLVRPAHPRDVPAIREMVEYYASRGILLAKATVTLYEDVQEFFVAEDGEQVIGCGALHVMWEDLAEVRTVAVRPNTARPRAAGTPWQGARRPLPRPKA